jgi:plasmid stability protein
MPIMNASGALLKYLTVRNLPADLARALEREKARSGASLNQTVIELLRRALGLAEIERSNGLAALAGTWSAEDLAEFEAAVADFERIDEELWR